MMHGSPVTGRVHAWAGLAACVGILFTFDPPQSCGGYLTAHPLWNDDSSGVTPELMVQRADPLRERLRRFFATHPGLRPNRELLERILDNRPPRKRDR